MIEHWRYSLSFKCHIISYDITHGADASDNADRRVETWWHNISAVWQCEEADSRDDDNVKQVGLGFKSTLLPPNHICLVPTSQYFLWSRKQGNIIKLRSSSQDFVQWQLFWKPNMHPPPVLSRCGHKPPVLSRCGVWELGRCLGWWGPLPGPAAWLGNI